MTFNVCEEKLILCVFEFPQLHGDIIHQLSDKLRRFVNLAASLLSFCWPKFIGLFAETSGVFNLAETNFSLQNHACDYHGGSFKSPY